MMRSAFTPDDVKHTVGRLTAAQRRAVAAGRLAMGPGYWPLRSALIEKGLMTTAGRMPVLTPFGRAVQVELKQAAP